MSSRHEDATQRGQKALSKMTGAFLGGQAGSAAMSATQLPGIVDPSWGPLSGITALSGIGLSALCAWRVVSCAQTGEPFIPVPQALKDCAGAADNAALDLCVQLHAGLADEPSVSVSEMSDAERREVARNLRVRYHAQQQQPSGASALGISGQTMKRAAQRVWGGISRKILRRS